MSGDQRNSDDDLGEVLFEFLTIGNAVKVSAVHVDTNTEVSIVATPATSEFSLKANVVRKLRSVLARTGH